MKLIIAGGRDYLLTPEDYSKLDEIHKAHIVTEVVSGKCKSGVDLCGEQWASRNGIPVKPFPANWEKFGKQAGSIRNRHMAMYADAVALFPGGRGTESMFFQARFVGITIFDFRNNPVGQRP